MRRGVLEGQLRLWWGGGGGMGGSLFRGAMAPPALLFSASVRLRDRAFRWGVFSSRAGPIPVISVGNLAVGGTGKTPVTRWVVRALREMGAVPAVVSSGYGEDEVLLHRRWFPDLPVVAQRDRWAGVAEAAAAGARVAVLDDGFQHLRLRRELDLVLLAAEHPLPVRLLPRGPYREPLASLRRAGVLILTRRSAPPSALDRLEGLVRRVAPDLPRVRMLLRPAGWQYPDGRPAPSPTGPVVALAGVAGPQAFAALVGRCTGAAVELVDFGDHHNFTTEEVASVLRAAGDRPVVTTEKDAVRLPPGVPGADAIRVLVLEVVVEEGEDALREALVAVAGRRTGEENRGA